MTRNKNYPFGEIWKSKNPMPEGVIWVLGAKGQLGRTFLLEQNSRWSLVGFDHSQFDITRPDHINTHLYSAAPDNRPRCIINCTAYSHVDSCEKNPDEALSVNALSVGLLAHACETLGITLVHISSDYIFDGSSRQPYKETFTPRPINQYGKSKLLGEQYIARQMISGNFLILRTSWVFSCFSGNFVTWTLAQLGRDQVVRAVTDQIGAPTYAPNFVRACFRCLALDIRGWLHYRNEPSLSRYQQAHVIARMAGFSGSHIVAVTRREMDWIAERPEYTVLDVSRYCALTNDVPQTWEKGLQEIIQGLL